MRKLTGLAGRSRYPARDGESDGPQQSLEAQGGTALRRADEGQRAPLKVSWEQALAWRMERQHLLERASSDRLVTVGDRLCGLHAQVMSSVELAPWDRTEGLTREAVRDASWRERAPVEPRAMRGTLHALPASGLGPWLGRLPVPEEEAVLVRDDPRGATPYGPVTRSWASSTGRGRARRTTASTSATRASRRRRTSARARDAKEGTFSRIRFTASERRRPPGPNGARAAPPARSAGARRGVGGRACRR